MVLQLPNQQGTRTMTDEFKSCPRCGGVNVGVYVICHGGYYDHYNMFGCIDCKLGSEEGANEKADIEKWNTRAAPKVKPLVWNREGFEGLIHFTPNMLIAYQIRVCDDGFCKVLFSSEIVYVGRSVSECKNAAQDHHTARVLSMLDGV